MSDNTEAPTGWKLVQVNDKFDALMTALDRAARKGYMPDAMAEEWEAFAYAAAPATPAAPPAAQAEPVPVREPGWPVAFEFYNPDTGHAIVDYSEHTHVGHLTPQKGYLKTPLYRSSAAAPTPAAQAEPYGHVTTHSVTGQQFFYRHPEPPYLDNARECVAVYAAPTPAAQAGDALPPTEDVVQQITALAHRWSRASGRHDLDATFAAFQTALRAALAARGAQADKDGPTTPEWFAHG